MKKLACEMCGSVEIIKNEGVYVCQHCGMKYSVEEAKKMMIDGVVEVQGTVKVDDTSKINNYYTMAVSAYNSGNKKEAETYCNKIIEISPENHLAWFLKGKAAGWQSTLTNVRIQESVNCFSKCIDNAPKNEIENLKRNAAKEISALSVAVLKICCANFENNPSVGNEKDILNKLQMMKSYSSSLLNKCGVTPVDFYKETAVIMNTSVCKAWKNIITIDYKHSEYPSKPEWEMFKERCFSCISILTEAINLSSCDDKADVQRYKNLIDITTALVNSCSYKYTNNTYISDWSLTKEAKEANINNIMKYHQKIKEIDSSYEIPERPQTKEESGCLQCIVWGIVIVLCILGYIFISAQ